MPPADLSGWGHKNTITGITSINLNQKNVYKYLLITVSLGLWFIRYIYGFHYFLTLCWTLRSTWNHCHGFFILSIDGFKVSHKTRFRHTELEVRVGRSLRSRRTAKSLHRGFSFPYHRLTNLTVWCITLFVFNTTLSWSNIRREI